ncbi:MAG: hypothetical protein ACRC51_07950 [Cetobacterium sp.]
MIKINTIKGFEHIKDYYYITTLGLVLTNSNGTLKALKQTKDRIRKAHLRDINGKTITVSIRDLMQIYYD